MAKTIVGDLIGKRGVVYAPVNQAGVLLLFSRLLDEFDMLVEQTAEDCGHVIGLRRVEQGWERVKIMIAFKSSDLENASDKDGDLLICWCHDWQECPLRTFELKSLFENGEFPPAGDKAGNHKKESLNTALADVTAGDSGELLQQRNAAGSRFEKAIEEIDARIKNIFKEDT
jgi:hypothetical protein